MAGQYHEGSSLYFAELGMLDAAATVCSERFVVRDSFRRHVRGSRLQWFGWLGK
jgi:hypothetical protein